MSGLDKIIDHITHDAADEAEKIVSAAKGEAEKILTAGKNDVLNRVQSIEKQSGLDVASALKRIQSASQLQEKRILLQAKQDLIGSVFAKAVARLKNLDDEQYSSVLSKMISRYASGEKGTVILSEKDLKRITPEFKAACEKAHLVISEKAGDIDGGFILSYGDIEENCSFDVLVNSSREVLQDKIGKLLFS